MAKVISYKVKLKLTRDQDGNVQSNLQEESMTPMEGTTESFEVSNVKIIQCAKEVSDFNQLQIQMAQRAMFASEDEREIEITQKRLIE